MRVYARLPLAPPAALLIETRLLQKVVQVEEYMKTLNNNMAPLLASLETMMERNLDFLMLVFGVLVSTEIFC